MGKSIGFFGNIAQTTDAVPIIGKGYNFYLENIEITSHINDSTVGLIAGTVNGTLQGIGIKNGKFNFPSVIKVKSAYTLMGTLGPQVRWYDSPDQTMAGNLLIDPNYPGSEFPAAGMPYAANVPVTNAVPNSITGTAYYVGALQRLINNVNSQTEFYYYHAPANNLITIQPGVSRNILSSSQPNTLLTAANHTLVRDDFWERAQYMLMQSNVYSVGFGTMYAPSITGNHFTQGASRLSTLPAAAGTNVVVPRNAIWFKPKVGGKSALAFFRNNQGGSGKISVYSYKRVMVNNVETITNWAETSFTLDSQGNRKAVYFDFVIPKIMAEEGYEFLVAASSINPDKDIGFFYLSLSGSDLSGDDGSAQVDAVDYVYYLDSGKTQFPNLLAENYVPNRLALRFDGTTTGNAYFNMKDFPANDGKVYFNSANTSSSPLLITDLTNGTVAIRDTSTPINTTLFPPRFTT